jgi:hypothetical protein
MMVPTCLTVDETLLIDFAILLMLFKVLGATEASL